MTFDISFLHTIFGETLPISPEIILIIGALIIPGLFMLTKKGKVCAVVAELFVAVAAIEVALLLNDKGYFGTYMDLFSLDQFSALMMLLFLAVVFLVILISPGSPEVTKHQGEYYSLLLVALTGMLFVASSTSLLTIFIGVECVSITSYALVAMKKNDPRAAEAGVKYLIIGGLSSALTLYGISMLYGLTGTLQIAEIGSALATMSFSWPFVIAMVSIIAGYGFKIAAVPFHMWAPDVYEGAATPISMFLATGSKKMGFVVLFKIFFVLFVVAQSGFATGEMQYVFAIIAAITMTVGNVVAISQTNIKRMLAYSSIAQAGYIMIALAVMSQYALTGGLFHMFTHVFMKGGAFIVVAALIAAGLGENISDYKGLAKRAPFVAAAMLLFLFSLAGIPPLAGFTSKFVLFSSAIVVDGVVVTQWVWLAFVAILNSAISLYYYARVVKAMYVDKGETEEKLKIKKSHIVAIAICVVFVIVLGVYPGPLLDLCSNAAAFLFS
jgi:proton-translocating NADH-quinone oxidoreductase chain N